VLQVCIVQHFFCQFSFQQCAAVLLHCADQRSHKRGGAEAVGANALLVRVGAYYHDIGKLIRPLYFKENQMGENPHDKTDPRVSTAILTEHTRDGVELARRHHLPEPIIDMIRQHHGDTPVMYFYAKAVKMFGEEKPGGGAAIAAVEAAYRRTKELG